MVYLMIYLNISCILLMYELIIKNKRVRKDIAESQEDDDIDYSEFSNVGLLLLATIVTILAVVTILPFSIYKLIKRVI